MRMTLLGIFISSSLEQYEIFFNTVLINPDGTTEIKCTLNFRICIYQFKKKTKLYIATEKAYLRQSKFIGVFCHGQFQGR